MAKSVRMRCTCPDEHGFSEYSGKTGFVLARHYTTESAAAAIVRQRKFGGANCPRRLDQGRVFVDLDERLLTPQEVAGKYHTRKGIGEAVVEFFVPAGAVREQIGEWSGRTEHYLVATSCEEGRPAYEIRTPLRALYRR